jgi:hypothetical protein
MPGPAAGTFTRPTLASVITGAVIAGSAGSTGTVTTPLIIQNW